jgi:hypothetical protein
MPNHQQHQLNFETTRLAITQMRYELVAGRPAIQAKAKAAAGFNEVTNCGTFLLLQSIN